MSLGLKVNNLLPQITYVLLFFPSPPLSSLPSPPIFPSSSPPPLSPLFLSSPPSISGHFRRSRQRELHFLNEFIRHQIFCYFRTVATETLINNDCNSHNHHSSSSSSSLFLSTCGMANPLVVSSILLLSLLVLFTNGGRPVAHWDMVKYFLILFCFMQYIIFFCYLFYILLLPPLLMLFFRYPTRLLVNHSTSVLCRSMYPMYEEGCRGE